MAVDFKAIASKKVAGIPIIYVVLGVAIIAVVGAIRLKPSPDPVEPAADDADEFAGDAGDTSQPVFSATPTIMQPSGVNSVTSTPQADSDELWKRRAIDWLRQNGFSIDVATSAINKYLDGENLTDVEKTARDKAVNQFGLPPEGVPSVLVPSPTQTAPASGQGVPPLVHVVKSTSDDTFSELAKLYYGFNAGNSGVINLLRSQNVGMVEPFRPGQNVKVPKFTEPKWYKATADVRSATKIAAKNGTTAQVVMLLNPAKTFPVAVGTQVRVK